MASRKQSATGRTRTTSGRGRTRAARTAQAGAPAQVPGTEGTPRTGSEEAMEAAAPAQAPAPEKVRAREQPQATETPGPAGADATQAVPAAQAACEPTVRKEDSTMSQQECASPREHPTPIPEPRHLRKPVPIKLSSALMLGLLTLTVISAFRGSRTTHLAAGLLLTAGLGVHCWNRRKSL